MEPKEDPLTLSWKQYNQHKQKILKGRKHSYKQQISE